MLVGRRNSRTTIGMRTNTRTNKISKELQVLALYITAFLLCTRTVPFALAGTPVNKAGLDYYSDLIGFARAKGMIPTVMILYLLYFFDSTGAISVELQLNTNWMLSYIAEKFFF